MKYKVTFTASQPLCGTRNIFVVQRTLEFCLEKIEHAFKGKSFEVTIGNVEQVDESFPSGFFNNDPKRGSIAMENFQVSGNLEQGQTH